MTVPMVSIDLETTGLDPYHHEILEIGAVIDPNFTTSIEGLSYFNCFIRRDQYIGDAKAIHMNRDIFAYLAGRKSTTIPIYSEEEAMSRFYDFLDMYDRLIPAGKNFNGFDRQFLKSSERIMRRLSYRSIDVGNLYWNPYIDHAEIPDLRTCMTRAGIADAIPHRALGDALLVVRLVRAYVNKLEKGH